MNIIETINKYFIKYYYFNKLLWFSDLIQDNYLKVVTKILIIYQKDFKNADTYTHNIINTIIKLLIHIYWLEFLISLLYLCFVQSKQLSQSHSLFSGLFWLFCCSLELLVLLLPLGLPAPAPPPPAAKHIKNTRHTTSAATKIAKKKQQHISVPLLLATFHITILLCLSHN